MFNFESPGGFSQGGTLALHAGMGGGGEALAGVFAMSSFINNNSQLYQVNAISCKKKILKGEKKNWSFFVGYSLKNCNQNRP